MKKVGLDLIKYELFATLYHVCEVGAGRAMFEIRNFCVICNLPVRAIKAKCE